MPLPGDLTTTTVTGQFVSTSGAPVQGTVTFSPSSTLLDPTSQMVIPVTGSAYPLSSTGQFTSDPLIATDNEDLEPQGWAYLVKVELQDLQAYTFTTFLPSSPSTVDLSALEPVSVTVGGTTFPVAAPGSYLPTGGGTETGPVVFDASPPFRIVGATSGQILVSDSSGNFTAQANTFGSANSIDGVTVSGTVAAGRTIIVTGTGPDTAAWTLPLQVDTSAGDIAPLAASASAGVLTQAAAADHAHPTTGLVDTTSTQSIAGAKTFTSAVTLPSAPPSNPTDAANKAYVDASAAGLSVKLAVQEATTAALSPGNTYANGTLGVGATLTATGNGTLTVDGVLVALNDRVLVKNEAAPANNGIYLCTTAGTSGVPYVLTRATDMDQAAEVPGAFTFVVNGTQAGFSFAVTAGGPYTVGTTAITWTLFSSPAAVTAGNTGVTVAGSAVSLAIPVTVAHGGTNAITASAGLANLGGAAVAGDLGNTSAAPHVTGIGGTAVDAPTGGAASFLNAAGHWTAPAGSGGASIDTSTTPHALGTASPGVGPGASPADHAHPATGVVTSASVPQLSSLQQSTGGGVLTGLAGAATSGDYLRGSGSTIGLSAIQAADLPAATTLIQGAVILDPATGDIKASPGNVAAGGSGKAADASHIHGQPNTFAPTGLTGATTASRYVGATTSGAPASGTFAKGDFTVDQTGSFWICTTAGTVGSGAAFLHLVGGTGLSNPMTTLGDMLYDNGTSTAARLGLGTAGQNLTAATPAGSSTPALAWANPSPDWVNVKTMFGAYGASGHDDTTAINNAIASLPSSGGTIYFPAGQYSISGTLNLPTWTTTMSIAFAGDVNGYGTKIQSSSTTADIIYGLNVKAFTMTNIQLQGPNSGTGIGLHLQSSGGGSDSIVNVHVSDCSVYQPGGDGIKIDNPLNVMISRCTVTQPGGNGFNLNGLVGGTGNPGTSALIENCYAIAPGKAGYALTGIHYSAVIGTATDGGGAGYVLTGCQHLTMVSPGCEAPIAGTSPYLGQGFEFSGCLDVTVISPLLRANPYIAYWVTGSSKNTMLINPAEISVAGSPAASIQVDAGSYCSVIRGDLITATNYASGTTVGVPGVIEAGDTNDRFNVDTAGKAWWGSGSGAVDTNLYRSAANVLKTDDSLVVTGSASVDGTFLSNTQPGDLDMLAWAWDPGVCNGSTTALGGTGTVGAGIVYLIKIPLYGQALSPTGVRVSLGATGSGLTTGQNFCYLFNSAGVFQAATADQTANWNTGATLGAVDAPWGGSPAVSGAFCWVGLVYNGTTGPSLLRGSVLTPGMANGRLTNDLSRYGSFGTGKTTATPGSIPAPLASNITQRAAAMWAALY